jgi:hypothetical protein
MGKLICEIMMNGALVVKSLTTVSDAITPILVKTTPGVGKPYWYWPTIPAGTVIGADFTNAPIASAVTQENVDAIAAITALPQDVLVYAPPPT